MIRRFSEVWHFDVVREALEDLSISLERSEQKVQHTLAYDVTSFTENAKQRKSNVNSCTYWAS